MAKEESVSDSQRLRVFCAIDLPDDVRARAAARIAGLRAAFPHVRASWERAEKLHVTLKFIGEIEPMRVSDLSQAAERAASGRERFELVISGAGAFPPRGAARVLWLGVGDSSGGLKRLAARLEDECEAVGFARERRQFSPHLTIARLREPRDAHGLTAAHTSEDFAEARFKVSELLVVRSVLSPSGSHYTTVSRHALMAG